MNIRKIANVGAYRIRPAYIIHVDIFGRMRYAPTVNWVKCWSGQENASGFIGLRSKVRWQMDPAS